jgi:hypothetical protein
VNKTVVKDSAVRIANERLFLSRGVAEENRLAAKLMSCGGAASRSAVLERSRRLGRYGIIR